MTALERADRYEAALREILCHDGSRSSLCGVTKDCHAVVMKIAREALSPSPTIESEPSDG